MIKKLQKNWYYGKRNQTSGGIICMCVYLYIEYLCTHSFYDKTSGGILQLPFLPALICSSVLTPVRLCLKKKVLPKTLAFGHRRGVPWFWEGCFVLFCLRAAFVLFEMGSHYVVQAGLELAVWPSLIQNSESPSSRLGFQVHSTTPIWSVFYHQIFM